MALASAMLRRPLDDVIKFARVLAESAEMKDLGESILQTTEYGEMLTNCRVDYEL